MLVEICINRNCTLNEYHFSAPPECEAEQFSCLEYVWNHTYCIPTHQRCDKINDCKDKSDEEGCCKFCSFQEPTTIVKAYANISNKRKMSSMDF